MYVYMQDALIQIKQLATYHMGEADYRRIVVSTSACADTDLYTDGCPCVSKENRKIHCKGAVC